MAISLLILYALALVPGVCKISINGANINLFGILTLLCLPFMFARFLTEKGLITKIKKRKVIFFLLLWLLVDIFSIIRAIDIRQWIRYNYFFISGISLAILVAFYIRTKKQYCYFLVINNFMLFIHNIIAWNEIILEKYFFLASKDIEEIYITNKYPVSMFGNTNDLAIFLTISIFLILIFNNLINNKSVKLLNAFLFFSSLVLIYKTQSRACWAALAIGITVWLLLKIQYTRRTYQFLLLFGVVSALLSVGLLTYYIISFNVVELNSIGMRINLIKNGITLLFQTWGIGVGSSNIEPLMMEKSLLPTAGMVNMHNWWVEVLVSFGIIIFALYVSVYIKCILRTYQKVILCKNSKERNLYSILISLYFVFAVACISSSSINSYGWIWIFYGGCISVYYFLSDSYGVSSIDGYN